MKKKPVAKKTSTTTKPSSSNDAVMLGGLYLLTFIVFQVVNFLSESIKSDYISMEVLQAKCITQFLPFLTAYFITLIYIKNRST